MIIKNCAHTSTLEMEVEPYRSWCRDCGAMYDGRGTWVHPEMSYASPKPKSKAGDKSGVHRTHCCIVHGCKYGDIDCPVESGKIDQDFPCEDCTRNDSSGDDLPPDSILCFDPQTKSFEEYVPCKNISLKNHYIKFDKSNSSNPSKVILKDKIIHWFLNYNTGHSAVTMARVVLNKDGDIPALSDNMIYYPLDPSDFHRCMTFLNVVPEAYDYMEDIAKLNYVWKNLVRHWNELETLYKEGFPLDKGYCLYERMKKIIEEGEQSQKTATDPY